MSNLSFPKCTSQELHRFLFEVLRQLDLEFVEYVVAFESGRLIKYFVQSNYCQNLSDLFRLLQFLFDQAQVQPELAKNVGVVILSEQQLLQPLVRFCYCIASSPVFFMDRFQVNLFDAFEARSFLQKIQRFCVHFAVFLCSVSHFVQDFERRVVQDSARISEVVCALFSCEGWILQKLLLCVQEAEYSAFTLQFEQSEPDGSLLHLLSQSSYDFLRMLQQTPSFRPSEQFIVQLFGCIKQMLKYINHPTSTSVHLTEE